MPQLDMEALYLREGDAPLAALTGGAAAAQPLLSGIVWTPGMRRMYSLLERCALPKTPKSDFASNNCRFQLLSLH